MGIVLAVALISLFVYPQLSEDVRLSPQEAAYQEKFDSASKEMKENLCGGMLDKLMLGIGSCRTEYSAQEVKCSEEKDVESCMKEVKSSLKSCVMLSVEKYCPELIR